MGTEDEVAALKEENARLHRVLTLYRRVARIAGITLPREDDDDGREMSVAEYDGLRFTVSPGEDPEVTGAAIRRVLDRAAGKLTD
jgi:hypothetical protein